MEISCDSIMPPKHPWFVSQKVGDEGDNTQYHIFYNIHDPMSHYRCQIPELLGKRIRGCFHGSWAVLSSNHPRDVIWSLWNPITSKIINLPPLNRSGSEGDCGDISECCLTAPPEDPNSVLLLMRTAKPNFVYSRLGIDSTSLGACNIQDLRWTESTYANQINILTDGDGSLHCLTCCNGKVYAYIDLSKTRARTRLIVEVNIVVNECEIKKQREAVITLLPLLEFVSPLIIDCPLILPLLKGSSTELFLVVLGVKDKGKTVGAVNLFKLDMNNTTWVEIEDLKDTILSVELDTDTSTFYSPAIASSEFGGYIHILADKGKIIQSYHVKDKTISFSTITCVARTNHVSAWTMLECTRLGVGRVHVHSKPRKRGHKEDEIVVRSSVKGNHGGGHIVCEWRDHDQTFDDLNASTQHLRLFHAALFYPALALAPPVAESHLINFRNGVLKWCFEIIKRATRMMRSVKGNNEADTHLLTFGNGVMEMKESCVGVECRLKSDKGDDDESHLLNLPPHILEMLIMEFCTGVEYLKFRATCKSCHLAAPPLIPWNNGKASKMMQKYSVPSPWLIVFDKHKDIITLTDPVFGDKYFIKTPQELICDFQIKCSRFGWLLVLKPDGSLMFYNPFTSEILELPQLPYTDLVCFSEPPTSPHCMVVGFRVDVDWYACVLVGGEPSSHRFLFNVWNRKTINSVTFFGRDLYASRDDGGVELFDRMDHVTGSWDSYAANAPASRCASLPQYFHLKCDQHLLQVIVGKSGEFVEVFKLASTKVRWKKVAGLGKHMIFISGASSVCLDAKTPQMENKIYLASSPITYYSLETCRFHTLNNEEIKDSFGDFLGMRRHLSPHGWIEPRWSS